MNAHKFAKELLKLPPDTDVSIHVWSENEELDDCHELEIKIGKHADKNIAVIFPILKTNFHTDSVTFKFTTKF